MNNDHYKVKLFNMVSIFLLLISCLSLAGCAAPLENISATQKADPKTDPTPFTLTTSSISQTDQSIAQLKDPDPKVRKAAAIDLQILRDSQAVDPLIACLNDPDPDVRGAVMEALGYIGDERAVAPLIAALEDKDQTIQQYAGSGLEKIGSPAVEPLIIALQDGDPALRIQAAEVLAGLQDQRAVEPLVATLNDNDKDVREAAIEALGRLKDARALQPLTDLLGDKEIGLSAAFSLAKFGEPAIVHLSASMESNDGTTLNNAICGLEEIGASGLPVLIEALQNKNPTVRRIVAESLGSKDDPRVVEPLINALKDPEASVRENVIAALGKKNDARVIEPINSALQDKDLIVESGAIFILKKWKDPSSILPLIGVLSSSDWTTSSMAETVLVSFGPAAVDPLITALQNNDPDTRVWAARALDEIGDERSTQPLLDALQRKDIEVAAGAYNFYVKQGVPDSEGILIQALNEYGGHEGDGGRKMAGVLLLSGNQQFEAAVNKWAAGYKYSSWELYLLNSPKWGSAR
jgi:HEAT repeat protein